MSNNLKRIVRGISFGVLFGVLGINSAFAREHEGMDWHRGHWIHDRHGGRLGWWWVLGPSWSYYERPYFQPIPQTVIVQQVPPPVTVVQQQPAPQAMLPAPPVQSPVLFYCRATGTHYPETMSCPGGWMTMTAGTPPQP